MKIEVRNETRNDLLHRREIQAEILESATTPARKDITSALAAKLGVAEGTIMLESVMQDFGRKAVRCSARVYETPEFLRKCEPGYLSERGKPREAKPKEEKHAKEEKAEAKKEEKKAEEKK